MSLLLHIVAVTTTAVSPGNLPTGDASQATVKDVLGIARTVIGALALLMITVSGLRYTLAGGDAQKVSKAKNGIIYSLVGLMVAIFTEVILYFVVSRL
jgi:uncharacterized sodium:solute symporter family permease YidK